MAQPRFDVVVFDLGGVLVQIAHDWREAHTTAGLDPHPILDDPDFEDTRATLGTAHQLGALADADFYRLTADASRGVYSAAQVERILHVWSGPEYPDVGIALDAVEAAGVATAALSNTVPAHWARLDGTSEYPAVARLQHRHASHRLGLAKPDPRIFEAFTALTGFEAERTLFFDDAAANVEAARAAGWSAERVDPAHPTAPQLLAHLQTHGFGR